MSAQAELTDQLRREVLALEHDLRARVDIQDGVAARWRAEHAGAMAAGRTASTWEPWCDDRVTQAAVAWVLTTVFVRFCEDNQLVTPVWISGPGRRQEALDAQLAYFRATPEQAEHTDREWLLDAVGYLAGLPATRDLVDSHSPLHWVSPSGDAASRLLEFWRERDENQVPLRDLTDSARSTRFLGDLYQDLSQHAQDTYALKQTPEFVEEFILDRTLEPALRERPLDGFRLIDPTCGSGHFLLGAFPRLLDRWEREAPALERRARVQKALDALHGVDLNPFAVAITRLRLTIAALGACGDSKLEGAPDFRYHVAVGDSLLHGGDPTFDLGPEVDVDAGASGFVYSSEDLDQLRSILQNGRYDVVVGNPPYITVKDKALNKLYRGRYTYGRKPKTLCKGTYSMSVPCMARFFELAKPNGKSPAGWVGQITSNSFMKREFGAPLIEEFLAKHDLRLLIDTSGAHIPGHGTPTVIVVGRPQSPIGSTIRAVLQIRGEPGVPADPTKGHVWCSIAEHWDDPGHEDKWTSTADLDRNLLATHPWSLTGGGAVELGEKINQGSGSLLSEHVAEIGFGAVTRDNDAFVVGSGHLGRRGVPSAHQRPLVEGESARDWSLGPAEVAVWPYDPSTLGSVSEPSVLRILWPFRAQLSGRVYGLSQLERGLEWFEYSMFFKKRYRVANSITFAFVATHNQFVFDHGGKVFNRTAPVIKLAEGATEEQHLELLGVLNSSTACFWLKQNSQNKGNGGIGGGIGDEAWEPRYEFTGTTLLDFPLPAELPLDLGRRLDTLAQQLATHTPAAVCERGTPTRNEIDKASAEHDRIRATMITLQEELDWQVYRLYGLITAEQAGQVSAGGHAEPLALGQRAFEIALARQCATGEEETAWFTRHGSTPITDIPAHWPTSYRDTVQHRLDVIDTEPSIRLLEKPEYKRRWSLEPWAKREQAALRDWLLDRLEDRRYWFDRHDRPTPRSVAQLADQASRDAELTGVIALWEGRPDVPLTESLTRLLADQAVPYLAAYRYKESGLRTRVAWERTWDLQRREDAGEALDGPIPVPPRYTSADFTKTHYWQARGKLDVPKERFIGYPGAGRDTDPTPLLGWARWDHAEQALALGMVINEREQDGWDDERLIPLVAGLAELQPWVRQWHTELHPVYGVNTAEFCATQLTQRAQQVARTIEQLAAWRPTPARRGRKRSS